MDTNETYRTWSFVGLLVGGVLILLGGLVGATMMGLWGGPWMTQGMMDGGPQVSQGWVNAMAIWMGAWALVTGALCLVAAWRVRQGHDLSTWGVIGIVAGALSFFAMGGYVVGGVAAILGGAFAVAAGGRAGDRTPTRPRRV